MRPSISSLHSFLLFGIVWSIARQFAFDLFDAWQAGLQLGGQGFHKLIFRDTQRLVFAAQRVFRHHLVFGFAQQWPMVGLSSGCLTWASTAVR